MLVLNPGFEYFGNDSITKQSVQALRRLFREKFVTVDLAYLKLIETGGNQTINPVCRAVASTIVVSPDNYLLYPCYHHATKRRKIDSNLYDLYHSPLKEKMEKQEGRFPFCQGCTIYCYMRGSFYRWHPFRKFGYLSFKSGFKYIVERYRR